MVEKGEHDNFYIKRKRKQGWKGECAKNSNTINKGEKVSMLKLEHGPLVCLTIDFANYTRQGFLKEQWTLSKYTFLVRWPGMKIS